MASNWERALAAMQKDKQSVSKVANRAKLAALQEKTDRATFKRELADFKATGGHRKFAAWRKKMAQAFAPEPADFGMPPEEIASAVETFVKNTEK